MAKKQQPLLIAYYPTVEEAQKAGQTLKDWDKNLINIDLGAMGILSMDENGKVKTEKIGDHVVGKGAKWGLLAGAVGGIFTGGLTLVAGALVGAAAGAVAGSFFHRGLGMTDEQKEQLENHLKGGGAALAVITPEEQVAATTSVLMTHSKEVVLLQMDEETVAKLDETGGSPDA